MSQSTPKSNRATRRAAGTQTKSQKLASKRALIAPFFLGNGDRFDDEYNFVMDQWTHTGISLREFGRAALLNAAVSVSREVKILRDKLAAEAQAKAEEKATGDTESGAFGEFEFGEMPFGGEVAEGTADAAEEAKSGASGANS